MTTIQPELAEAILEVIDELATELDLHYEAEDLVATGPTLVKLERLATLVKDAGYPLPSTYKHIMDRFARAVH